MCWVVWSLLCLFACVLEALCVSYVLLLSCSVAGLLVSLCVCVVLFCVCFFLIETLCVSVC